MVPQVALNNGILRANGVEGDKPKCLALLSDAMEPAREYMMDSKVKRYATIWFVFGNTNSRKRDRVSASDR